MPIKPFAAAISLAVLLGLPAAADPPSDAFKQTYQRQLQDIKKADTVEERNQQLKRLLEHVDDHRSQPALQVEICEQVYVQAKPHHGSAVVMDAAMRRLAEIAPDRREEAWSKINTAYASAYKRAPKGPGRVRVAAEYAIALFSLGEQQLEANQFDAASRTFAQAGKIAKDASDPMQEAAKWGASQSRLAASAMKRLGFMEQRWEATPDNPSVAAKLAEQRLLLADDAEGAMAPAEASGDDELKRIIALAARPADRLEPADAARLATWLDNKNQRLNEVSEARVLKRIIAAAERAESDESLDQVRADAEKRLAKLEAIRKAGREITVYRGRIGAAAWYHADVYVNRQDGNRNNVLNLVSAFSTEVESEHVELRTGDIVAARLPAYRGEVQGFWLSFKTTDGSDGSFTTGPRGWVTYTPRDTGTWWDIDFTEPTGRVRLQGKVSSYLFQAIEKYTGRSSKGQVIWGPDRDTTAYVYYVVR